MNSLTHRPCWLSGLGGFDYNVSNFNWLINTTPKGCCYEKENEMVAPNCVCKRFFNKYKISGIVDRCNM